MDLTQDSPKRKQRKIRFFEVPQVVPQMKLGHVPSSRHFYIYRGKYDLPESSFALQWDDQREFIVGEFAREQGAKCPEGWWLQRKSWLCHGGVDRRANILPWGAEGDIPKVSPVDASMRYLQHIRESWDHLMRRGKRRVAVRPTIDRADRSCIV
ncbi:MAG: hypothetical protein R3C26_13825 [Calditrichia bacterium]